MEEESLGGSFKAMRFGQEDRRRSVAAFAAAANPGLCHEGPSPVCSSSPRQQRLQPIPKFQIPLLGDLFSSTFGCLTLY